MKEELQSYIYTEKLLANLYRRAAALTSDLTEQKALLAFSNEATKNAEYLNYFYKQEYGTNYDPMIPDVVIQGGYRGVLNQILEQEMASFMDIRRHTYFQENYEFRETMRAIADFKLGHILTLFAILTGLNNPDNQD